MSTKRSHWQSVTIMRAAIVRQPLPQNEQATAQSFPSSFRPGKLGDSLDLPSIPVLRSFTPLNRFVLALKAFWFCLSNAEFAARVAPLFHKVPTGPDLRILAVLQRDGRLVDFLLEDIDGYEDSQIGAAVRDIHRGCRKALKEYLTVEPVLPDKEDASVLVPAGFDPATIRLIGNVAGSPPFKGILKHHGWRVKASQLPVVPGARDDSSILAPAEVEIS